MYFVAVTDKQEAATFIPLSAGWDRLLVGILCQLRMRMVVEQIYLASPSRFPVMTDLSCRLISASAA
jgi:hypothetical protein